MAKPLWKENNLKRKPFASGRGDKDRGIETPCFIGFGVPKPSGSAELECQMLRMRVWRPFLAQMCLKRWF